MGVLQLHPIGRSEYAKTARTFLFVLFNDADVEHLMGLKDLDTLTLAQTRVTDKCVPDFC